MNVTTDRCIATLPTPESARAAAQRNRQTSAAYRITQRILGRLAVGIVCLLVLGSSRAQAQIVIAPTQATFPYADTDLAVTASFQVAFFQCSSVTANPVACAHAPAPIQTVTYPKSAVGGTAASRTLLLAAAPINGTLPAFPAGVGFVAEIAAVGDPTQPGIAGASAFSPDSNPFFGSARTPAVPGNVVVK